MIEIWKIIDMFPYYEISNYGRVKSLRRGIYRKLTIDPRGYAWVKLHHHMRQKIFFIQVLVTHAFIGPKPLRYQVNHKDGNKLNNHIDNLEYVTAKQNTHHAIRIGLRKNVLLGEANPMAKLTKEIVLYILHEVLIQKRPQIELHRELNISRQNISKIVRRELWRHINEQEYRLSY